jgi:hypothetical protein
MSIESHVRDILEPFVGPAVVGMCLRAAAAKVGKNVDELTPADLSQVASTVRTVLTPIAPPETIEALATRIEEEYR